MAPHPVCQWDLFWDKVFYHTKMAHNLVSVYSVFFRPHSISESTIINSIHITHLVYTCIITSFDFSLAPSLSMTYRMTSDHLLFPFNYLNETKRLKVEHQWHSESANLLQAPIFTCWLSCRQLVQLVPKYNHFFLGYTHSSRKFHQNPFITFWVSLIAYCLQTDKPKPLKHNLLIMV